MLSSVLRMSDAWYPAFWRIWTIWLTETPRFTKNWAIWLIEFSTFCQLNAPGTDTLKFTPGSSAPPAVKPPDPYAVKWGPVESTPMMPVRLPSTSRYHGTPPVTASERRRRHRGGGRRFRHTAVPGRGYCRDRLPPFARQPRAAGVRQL